MRADPLARASAPGRPSKRGVILGGIHVLGEGTDVGAA